MLFFHLYGFPPLQANDSPPMARSRTKRNLHNRENIKIAKTPQANRNIFHFSHPSQQP